MPVQRDQRTGVPEVAGLVRTCVGCRRRDSDSRLLRIVHDPQAAALVPDPRRRAEGRGAWVHRDERCIATALDRRALTRSLRVAGAVSHDAVAEVLEALRLERENEERTSNDEHTVKLQR